MGTEAVVEDACHDEHEYNYWWRMLAQKKIGINMMFYYGGRGGESAAPATVPASPAAVS